MLMGPDVVVPGSEFDQFDAQVVNIGKDDAVQLLLERAENRSIRPFCQGQCRAVVCRRMPSSFRAAFIARELKQASLSTRRARGIPN